MGNTDKQHGAGQLGSDRRYLVAVIGFTCLYAVCVSFFYSSWLSDGRALRPRRSTTC